MDTRERSTSSRDNEQASSGLWLRFFWRVLRLFGGRERRERVVTTTRIAAPVECCWECVMFYEEIRGAAPWMLRAVLPSPLHARGSKTSTGARVDCVYTSGHLTKCIRELVAPHRMVFDVVESHLGLEDCVAAVRGSYEIRGTEGGSEVVLTTLYRSVLAPGMVFRPLEAMVLHKLHRYVLQGLESSVHEGRWASDVPDEVIEKGSDGSSDDSVSTAPAAARGRGGSVAV